MKLPLQAAPLLAVPSLLLASCASIMTGNTSTIEVTSNPVGATVKTSTGLESVTPCDFVLPNGKDVEVTATHGDYAGQTRTLVSTPDTSRWAAGNILFGGAVGLASDAANSGNRVHKKDLHFDFEVSVQEIERLQAEAQRQMQQAVRSSGGTLR